MLGQNSINLQIQNVARFFQDRHFEAADFSLRYHVKVTLFL
tara:strand:- start:4317 stop:4439 length:123 start_codon:yes stop_codon:yes gene_type:complete